MKNSILILLISVIVLVGSFQFALLPKYREWEQAKQNADVKQKDLANIIDYMNTINQQANDIKPPEEGGKTFTVDGNEISYSKIVQSINAAMPNVADFSSPELFHNYQKTVQNSGLILDTISISPAKQTTIGAGGTNLEAYNVSLTMSGFFTDFERFLAAIEQSPRFVSVANMKFSSPAKNSDPFTFNVNTRVYVYPGPRASK